eukprot:UN06101
MNGLPNYNFRPDYMDRYDFLWGNTNMNNMTLHNNGNNNNN